jgi:hypothetical protein
MCGDVGLKVGIERRATVTGPQSRNDGDELFMYERSFNSINVGAAAADAADDAAGFR